MQNQFRNEKPASPIANPYAAQKPAEKPVQTSYESVVKEARDVSKLPSKNLIFRILSVVLLGAGLGLLFYSVYTFATSKKTEFQQTSIQPQVIKPTATPTPPIPGWQTYTSPQGFSIQYESPVIFTAEVNGEEDVLVYQLVSVEGKNNAFKITVSSKETDRTNVNDLGFSGASPVKIGKHNGLLLASPEKEIYYVIEKGKLFEIDVELLLNAETPASKSLKDKILRSFVAR